MSFRITQVIREFSTQGGVETVAWELQRAWTELGLTSTVMACTATENAAWVVKISPLLARIPTRGRWRHLGRLLAVPAFTLAASWKLRNRQDSVIVTHGDSLSGDVLIVHAVNRSALREKWRGGEWRWMLNPMHAWVGLRDWYVLGGLRVRAVVAVSNRVRAELMAEYRVPSERIRVIPHGIALDRFVYDRAAGARVRVEFGIPPDARLLLFVGHEFGRKGLAQAAGALAHLPDDTWLLAVGSDDGAPYGRYAGGAHQRLLFAGSRSDLSALYSAADAFVFPTAYETFSLVCMEAMACGVPIFATAVGGIEDYLQDGVNGMVIPRDAEGLAGILRPALADPDRLHAMGAAARMTAAAYRWPAVAARYQALLEEIWAEKQAEFS